MLYGLNHLAAVPIDTHIAQIANDVYRRKVPKSINATVYNELGR